MGQAMPYLQAKQLGHTLGGIAFTPAGTLYLLASTDAFSNVATAPVEPTDAAYARVPIPNDGSHFSAPSGANPTSVATLVEWAFAAATADWGTILSAYLIDSASGAGNLYYGTAINGGAGQLITTGSTMRVAVGAFIARQT